MPYQPTSCGRLADQGRRWKMAYKLFNNVTERDTVIAKIAAAELLINMAPATKGRLPISFGIPTSGSGGVPQVAISMDQFNVFRFYNNDNLSHSGILVHEEIATAQLREWAESQAVKFPTKH